MAINPLKKPAAEFQRVRVPRKPTPEESPGDYVNSSYVIHRSDGTTNAAPKIYWPRRHEGPLLLVGRHPSDPLQTIIYSFVNKKTSPVGVLVRTAVHKENEAPTLKPGEHGFVKRRLSPLEQARQPGEGITHESLVYRPLTPKELIALAAKKNFKKIA